MFSWSDGPVCGIVKGLESADKKLEEVYDILNRLHTLMSALNAQLSAKVALNYVFQNTTDEIRELEAILKLAQN